MGILIDPSGKQITLTEDQMMTNFKNNVQSFKQRNIEKTYTLKNSISLWKESKKNFLVLMAQMIL